MLHVVYFTLAVN